ncbi:unnamed protein product, partial [Prorocentrum cordatum]
MRDFSGRCLRRFASSGNGGRTWQEHSDAAELSEPQPGGCQASLLRVHAGAPSPRRGAGVQEQKELVVHCGPAAADGSRADLVLRVSSDGGLTWPRAVALLPERPGAYSCMALLPGPAGSGDSSVGVLFESGARGPYECLRLARVPLPPQGRAEPEQRAPGGGAGGLGGE